VEQRAEALFRQYAALAPWQVTKATRPHETWHVERAS
jgi:hypothetical protein